jgi:nucleoside-diphosphate-sugar epimerase
MSMRIAVIGGTGNVGTSVIESLARDERVASIVGLARRLPAWQPPKTEWARADITRDDLVPHLDGADVAIHLAWAIQPSRDEAELHRVNVTGSERVFDAAARAGVGAIVYASSIGAYSPGPKDRGVDESWPTDGIPSSFYSRHKAAVESILDRFEDDHPEVRVVRLRPGLIMKAEAAEEIRRLFAGPFLPSFAVRPERIPIVPDIPGVRVQAVHSRDVGEAYRLAATSGVRGAFNIAAAPVVDPSAFASHIGARTVPLPAAVARALADLTWRARLQPTPPGWLDMALECPIMDTARAREELGWTPEHDALTALAEVMEGMSEATGMPTPPLDPETSGRVRSREFTSGVGAKNP